MSDYGIRSTPNMIVNGKYLVATGENVRTQQEMLEIVDFLVEKERIAMAGSGTKSAAPQNFSLEMQYS